MATDVTRRAVAVLAACFAAGASRAVAQDGSAWPDRPVRLVVPLAPGGVTDAIARIVAQEMSSALPHPVVVENRPGATGNVGAASVARSAPDGHTLMLGTPGPMVNNQFIFARMPFDPSRDFRAVSLVARVPNAVVAHPSTGFRALPDLIAYARANPGRLNSASPGSGSAGHLSLALLMRMAGVELTHVPYTGGGPAMNDLLPGAVQMTIDNLPLVLPHVQSGALRALAVTTRERVSALPEVPTVAETLPGYETSSWFVVVAPAATLDGTIARIGEQVRAAVARPTARERLVQMAALPVGSGAEDAQRLLADETAKWGPVVRSLNMRVE